MWFFLTKLLTSGILFLTVVNAAVVAKLVILGIWLSISVIFALKTVFFNKFSVSLIFFSKSDLSVLYLVFKTNSVISIDLTIVINFSYTVFLTTSLFITLLNLLKSTGTIFTLSTLAFKLVMFDFSARLDVSIPVAPFKSVYVA